MNWLLAIAVALGASVDGETVTAVADERGALRFAYEHRVDGWDQEAYVLLPAAAYNGNRDFRRVPPPSNHYGVWYERGDFGSGRCPWRLHEKIPALNADNSGVLEGSAGDLSTPCVAVYLPKKQEGRIYWFQPQLKGRDAGFRLQDGTLRIEYPTRCKELLFKASATNDPPIVCTPKERVAVRWRVDVFPCRSVAGLYAAFFERRRAFVSDARVAAVPDDERRRLAELVAKRMVEDSIRETPDRGMIWSAGWCGGPMNIAALVNAGWPKAPELAARTLDFMAEKQTPCGLFRGLSQDGETVAERPDEPTAVGLHLLRRSADALFYAVPLLEVAGATPARERSLRRCADALIAIFDRCGELPQYVDQQTGESRIAGSTSAAMAPAALVRMAKRFGERRYRDAAARIAEQLCEKYLARDCASAGPATRATRATRRAPTRCWKAASRSRNTESTANSGRAGRRPPRTCCRPGSSRTATSFPPIPNTDAAE